MGHRLAPGKMPCPQTAGPWFNIKMSFYQYRKSHCGDKTIARSFYLHNGIFYTGKMVSLYWISPQGLLVSSSLRLLSIQHVAWQAHTRQGQVSHWTRSTFSSQDNDRYQNFVFSKHQQHQNLAFPKASQTEYHCGIWIMFFYNINATFENNLIILKWF